MMINMQTTKTIHLLTISLTTFALIDKNIIFKFCQSMHTHVSLYVE